MGLRHIKDVTRFYHGAEGEWTLCSLPWRRSHGRRCRRCIVLDRVRRAMLRRRARSRAQSIENAKAEWR